MMIKVDQYQSFKTEMIKDWLLTEENHLNILGHLVIAGVLKVFTRAIPPPPPALAIYSRTNTKNKHEVRAAISPPPQQRLTLVYTTLTTWLWVSHRYTLDSNHSENWSSEKIPEDNHICMIHWYFYRQDLNCMRLVTGTHSHLKQHMCHIQFTTSSCK